MYNVYNKQLLQYVYLSLDYKIYKYAMLLINNKLIIYNVQM